MSLTSRSKKVSAFAVFKGRKVRPLTKMSVAKHAKWFELSFALILSLVCRQTGVLFQAASMTDVSSDPDFDDKTGKPKSSSASTTPTRSNKDSSFASLVAKLTPSADKRKQKTEMKKLKVRFFAFSERNSCKRGFCFVDESLFFHFKFQKLLKNSNSKQRPSFLPDSALQSPLAELGNSSVKLKSLRPKGSVANMNYSLPLRANFGKSIAKEVSFTVDHKENP